MRPEQAECRFCGGCREEHNDYLVQDDQWLEEMGDLIAKAVECARRAPSYAVYCHKRVTAAAISSNLSE